VTKGYWINQSDVTDEAGHAVYAKADRRPSTRSYLDPD
jgi:hypothetical protein